MKSPTSSRRASKGRGFAGWHAAALAIGLRIAEVVITVCFELLAGDGRLDLLLLFLVLFDLLQGQLADGRPGFSVLPPV